MELRIPQPQITLHRRLLTENLTIPDNSFPDSDDDTQFDANMVIILSFLLCALLFVIGLNAFVRFGLRNPFRGPSPEQPAPPVLKKRALRQLPVAVYGSGPDTYSHECPICLGEFLDGERIRVLPKCSHGFHVGCIDTWLASNGSCPNCRMPLAEPPPPNSSTGRGAAPEQRVVAIDVWGL